MNLIQALPAPALGDVDFSWLCLDHNCSAIIRARYVVGGRIFRAEKELAYEDYYRLHRRYGFIRERRRTDEIIDSAVPALMAKLKQAIADHLAIINPIDND